MEANNLSGFEEGLIGLKAGEEKKLDITFPKDYQDSKLASKPVNFDIVVKEVLEPKVSEINEEFVKKLGIEDGKIETLHSKIKEGMEKDAITLIDSYMKKNVIKELSKSQNLEAPKTLVSEEFLELIKKIIQMVILRLAKKIWKNYMKEATERVKAGLLLREIINNEKFEITQKNISDWIDTVSRGNNNRSEIENYYMNNEDAKKNMESVILENFAVKWVIEKAEVSEKNYSFDKLMELR